VQAAIYQLSAKQIHEDPGGPKKHHRTQNQGAVDDREDFGKLGKISGRRNYREQHEERNWSQRQQIDEKGPLAEKILAQLEPEDGADLAQPERPARVRTVGLSGMAISVAEFMETSRYAARR